MNFNDNCTILRDNLERDVNAVFITYKEVVNCYRISACCTIIRNLVCKSDYISVISACCCRTHSVSKCEFLCGIVCYESVVVSYRAFSRNIFDRACIVDYELSTADLETNVSVVNNLNVELYCITGLSSYCFSSPDDSTFLSCNSSCCSCGCSSCCACCCSCCRSCS